MAFSQKEIAARYRDRHRDQINAKLRKRYHNDAAYREKHRATWRAWYDRNAERLRAESLAYYHAKYAPIVKERSRTDPAFQRRRWGYSLKMYGITPDEYDALLLKQEGRCALCSRIPHGKRKMAVDHDHATGRIRGIVCDRCNGALGAFGDTAESMRRVIRYLEGSP